MVRIASFFRQFSSDTSNCLIYQLNILFVMRPYLPSLSIIVRMMYLPRLYVETVTKNTPFFPRIYNANNTRNNRKEWRQVVFQSPPHIATSVSSGHTTKVIWVDKVPRGGILPFSKYGETTKQSK